VINAIFRGIEATSTEEQYRRLTRAIREYSIHDAVGGQVPPYTNVQAYLDFRGKNYGVYVGLFTAQYALDLHLTDAELAHPKLVMCETLCSSEFISATGYSPPLNCFRWTRVGKRLATVCLNNTC
jgi:hypothetical protein